MSTQTDNKKTIIAALVGVGALLLCSVILGLSLLLSSVIGVIVYVAMSRFGSSEVAGDRETGPANTIDQTPMPMSEPEVERPDPAPEPETQQAAAPVESAAQAAPPKDVMQSCMVKPGTILPGESELISRKGTWRYEG